MKITWFGQACFELVTANGTVVICDPYHPMTGYAEHPRRADIVTISHEHGDHNYVGWIQGTPEVLRGAVDRTVKDVRIIGLNAYHDDCGGTKRGPNTIFVFEANGLRLCHLGDLGHEPDDALYLAIGTPDVLFVPAGGFYTLEPGRAVAVAKRVNAKLTIPMHFNTGINEIPIATVDAFAEATGAEYQHGSELVIRCDDPGPRAVVLDYLR